MEDISFLSDKSGKPKKSSKKSGPTEIKWSTPETADGSDGSESAAIAAGAPSKRSSGFFSFFKKDGASLEKSDLLRSRGEVLEAISAHEKLDAPAPQNGDSGFFGKIFNAKEKNAGIDFKAELAAEEGKKGIKPTVLIPPVFTNTQDQASRTGIEPYRINMFNRLIDWWRDKQKSKIRQETAVPAREKASGKDMLEVAKTADKPSIIETSGKAGEAAVKKKDKPKKKDDFYLENSNILETNLMEGESISFIDWQQNGTVISVFIIIALIVLGMGYGGLEIYGRQQEAKKMALDSKIEDLQTGIADAEEKTDKYYALESKIKLIKILLSRHIYWTNLFKFIEDNTIADVYFLSFSGNTGGKYSLSAKARSFSNLTEQLAVFRSAKDEVLQVNINGGRLSAASKDNPGFVDFSLDITLKPDIFYK